LVHRVLVLVVVLALEGLRLVCRLGLRLVRLSVLVDDRVPFLGCGFELGPKRRVLQLRAGQRVVELSAPLVPEIPGNQLVKSRLRDLNPGPQLYESCALPLS
jgi:hypothetical protein